MAKFKNKYRIESTRLQSWDYSSATLYFITICTENRIHYFGEISDEKMEFSEIGKLVEKCWLEIPQHFPFLKLHNHVIMPNHVYGIIEMAETQNVASLQISSKPKNQFEPQSKNLASIVLGFKIGVTKKPG